MSFGYCLYGQLYANDWIIYACRRYSSVVVWFGDVMKRAKLSAIQLIVPHVMYLGQFTFRAGRVVGVGDMRYACSKQLCLHSPHGRSSSPKAAWSSRFAWGS